MANKYIDEDGRTVWVVSPGRMAAMELSDIHGMNTEDREDFEELVRELDEVYAKDEDQNHDSLRTQSE